MQNSPLFFNVMQADEQASPIPEIVTNPLLGTWVNVNENSQYLTTLIFTINNGTLLLRSYSAHESGSNDLGEIEIIPYSASGSTQINGFHGTYSFQAAEICYSGRVMGDLVEVMVNTRYVDDSERTNHFSREFFRQLKADTSPSDWIDFTDLLGTWVNSKSNSQGIERFILRQADQEIRLRPYGAFKSDNLTEVSVTPFVSPTGERAFLAHYHFDTHRIHIVANTNKGLWVLATHYIYQQSSTQDKPSHPNFLRREFFYCIDTPNP